MGQWVPITVAIIMSAQVHFGGAIHKALFRTLGTVSGVIVSILVLWLFGNSGWVVFFTVFCSTLVFTYIASSGGDLSYAGTLGCVTVILVLSGQDANVTDALYRGSHIFVGAVIALLVSRLIFPFHAKDHLIYLIVVILRDLGELYTVPTLIKSSTSEERWSNFNRLNKRLRKHLAQQPKLIHETKINSFSTTASEIYFSSVAGAVENLVRAIDFSRAFIKEIRAAGGTVLEEYQTHDRVIWQAIADNLRLLADYLAGKRQQLSDFRGYQELANEITTLIDTVVIPSTNRQAASLYISLLLMAKYAAAEADQLKKLFLDVDGNFEGKMI